MAGYYEFSKSNNALAAEADGIFPASVLAKQLGVQPGAIRALLHSSEWHHSSKYFNCIPYYREDSALEILAELKAWQSPAKDKQVFENCSGTFLKWGGTRNHPYAESISFGPCHVTKRGKWFVLELPSGLVRKGESTRGFHLKSSDGKSLTWNCD
jgi:hypothetical protein